MKIVYSKQSEKFLNKVEPAVKEKIINAILNPTTHRKLASVGKYKGERYGVKIEHYRAIINREEGYDYVVTVDTKTNMKKLKYGYF